MRHLQTEVVVIGGGATGTGVLRDLAMRGFKCFLVERRDLAYGTTGRYHGLLHSGGRYVVKDSQAARECYAENQILRRIMPQCIEDTGGFFVLTPHDDPGYVPQFVDGCQQAGIPLKNVPISSMLKQEPSLNPAIQQCFYLPDASADSFLAADLNVTSARQHGAQVLTYHQVMNLVVNHESSAGACRVIAVECHDLVKDEDVHITTNLVINASGAWAGKIASLAGIPLNMVPGKGTLLALNQRVVNTVISRCKLPSDGDILVPTHTVSVIGTTDIKVIDPDHYGIEPWEVRLMLDEGEKLIPQFKQYRILRAWAGVRPLVQGLTEQADRDITRAFVLLDHADRDGVEGILTITGGKWTTYRKMAQVTVDKACEKLGVNRPCRTHLEPLPSSTSGQSGYHQLGSRLREIEQNERFGQLVCECELTTKEDIEQSIVKSNSVTLDDIRRDTRLGMGPCQGAFCAFRASGIMHGLLHPPVEETNESLRDFLQERWKGNLPILWGQQLRQARLNELIYVDVLNITALPGKGETALAVDEYSHAGTMEEQVKNPENKDEASPPRNSDLHSTDLVIIGAGFAGLMAAWRAASLGIKTKVISHGWGSPNWSSGCIDISGYQPPDYTQRVDSPIAYLETLAHSNPSHPYSLAGVSALVEAVQAFLAMTEESGYQYHGTLEKNILLPTALGSVRPTCLAPEMMLAGDASLNSPMLIVGFDGYLDLFPGLVAANLVKHGLLARDVTLKIKSLQTQKFINAVSLARLFDDSEFRQEVIEALKPRIGSVGRVGFPAVLGIKHAPQVKQELESALGLPIFEIPGLPPSIPGIRLQNLLIAEIEKSGGSVSTGMQVTGMSRDGNALSAVCSKTSSRPAWHYAKTYILATGGILGGGISTTDNGYAQEAIFNLPVAPALDRSQWMNNKFLAPTGHPIFRCGIPVDESFHPVGNGDGWIANNLLAIGSALANCDLIRERSLEGVALASSYAAVQHLVRQTQV